MEEDVQLAGRMTGDGVGVRTEQVTISVFR